MPDIVIVNTSTLFSDAFVAGLLPSLQKQISGDFAPYWGVDATLHFATGANDPGNIPYRLIVKDQPDDVRDMGFHLLDNGMPESRVFGQNTPQDQLASVIGHELLEMLANPSTELMAADGRHIRECGDPVEENGYYIDGIFVTDWVTPAYFGLNGDTRYDWNRTPNFGPCPMLLPAGYIMERTDSGWVSHFGRRADGTINERALESGRSRWRASRPVTPSNAETSDGPKADPPVH